MIVHVMTPPNCKAATLGECNLASMAREIGQDERKGEVRGWGGGGGTLLTQPLTPRYEETEDHVSPWGAAIADRPPHQGYLMQQPQARPWWLILHQLAQWKPVCAQHNYRKIPWSLVPK